MAFFPAINKDIRTYEFNVTNVSISTSFGAGWYLSALQSFDTGENLNGKKITYNYIPTNGNGCFLMANSIVDNSKLNIYFLRPDTGNSLTGKFYIYVAD